MAPGVPPTYNRTKKVATPFTGRGGEGMTEAVSEPVPRADAAQAPAGSLPSSATRATLLVTGGFAYLLRHVRQPAKSLWAGQRTPGTWEDVDR